MTGIRIESEGGGGGIPDPVTTDINLNDDVYVVYGTGSDSSVGFNTDQTTNLLWVGLNKFMGIGLEANKAFDYFAGDFSGIISDPNIFLFSGAQDQNEWVRFEVNASGRSFQIQGSDGDVLGGSATTDDGISVSYVGSDGGTDTTGGAGGGGIFGAGSGGGTNGAGADAVLKGGGADGGAPGNAWVRASANTATTYGNVGFQLGDGNTVYQVTGSSGAHSIKLPDNTASALQIYRVSTGQNVFQVDTSSGAQQMIYGDADETYDHIFYGAEVYVETGRFTLAEDTHFASTQATAPGVTVNTTTLNAGGGTGAAAAINSDATDTAGRVTITAGNGTPTAGLLATVTLNTTLANTAIVLLTPSDADAADNQLYTVNPGGGSQTFGIYGNVALNASEVIEVVYLVHENY